MTSGSTEATGMCLNTFKKGQLSHRLRARPAGASRFNASTLPSPYGRPHQGPQQKLVNAIRCPYGLIGRWAPSALTTDITGHSLRRGVICDASLYAGFAVECCRAGGGGELVP
jgi:hypothetical protein